MPDTGTKPGSEDAPAKTETLTADCTTDTSNASSTGTTGTNDQCKVSKEIPPEMDDLVKPGKGI